MKLLQKFVSLFSAAAMLSTAVSLGARAEVSGSENDAPEVITLYLASKFIKLSDEEAAAIRWHMGAFDCAFRGGDRGLNAAYEKYPLAVLLHMADMRATYLVERSDDHDR